MKLVRIWSLLLGLVALAQYYSVILFQYGVVLSLIDMFGVLLGERGFSDRLIREVGNAVGCGLGPSLRARMNPIPL